MQFTIVVAAVWLAMELIVRVGSEIAHGPETSSFPLSAFTYNITILPLGVPDVKHILLYPTNLASGTRRKFKPVKNKNLSLWKSVMTPIQFRLENEDVITI